MTGYLFVTGLIFALVGLLCLFEPNLAFAPLGLHFDTVSGLSQERGTAGGVTLAVGLFLMASAHFRKLSLPALWMVVMVLGGLEAGRLFSLVVDGVPGKPVWINAAVEVLGLAQGLFWLRRADAGG